MKKTSIYLIAMLAPMMPATAVDFPSGGGDRAAIMSQYGLIQNVQNYSSNPFWDPNGPYNQRMPQPVYVQGADLNAAQCQSVVSQLVAAQCASKNNCIGATISDVRPAIMIQLSRMSGANYVGSCSGFIEPTFYDYVSKNSGAVGGSFFPTPTVSGGGASDQPEFKIENPYKIQPLEYHGEEWMKDMGGRAIELQQLQSQNGANSDGIFAANMPSTYSDLSFTERMQNAQAGYEQYAGTSAYSQMNLETDERRRERELAEAAFRQQMGQSGLGAKKKDCDDKLKELAEAEAYIAKLRDCLNRGLTFDQCMNNINNPAGWGASESVIPGITNSDLTTSAVTGISTVAAIVMSAKNASAIRAGATPVAGTTAVSGVPGMNVTPVTGITTVNGVTTGMVNGRAVRWNGTNWSYAPGSGRTGFASNALQDGITSPVPGTPGTPASTNIQQTWRGAREVQGANSQLRAGQVAGQGIGGASTMAKVGGALMVVGGAYGIAQSASGNEEHGWGNVLSGALSGAATGAGAGMALNVIPAYGQVAYAVTVAAGAVTGALVGGSQMFSETDCARDPFIQNPDGTGVFTCCHTQFNRGQRWVDIGGDMTCGDITNPGIRTCLNGGSSETNKLMSDDMWSTECKAKYCPGWDAPESGTKAIFGVGIIPWDKKSELSGEPQTDAEKILYHSGQLCWMWGCEDGFERQGARCVPIGSNNPAPYNPVPGEGQSIESLIAQLEARAAEIRKECVQ